MALTEETKAGLKAILGPLGALIEALPYPGCATAGAAVKTWGPDLIVKAAEIAHFDQYVTVSADGGVVTIDMKKGDAK